VITTRKNCAFFPVQKLLELSRKQKPLSAYEEIRKNLLDYLARSVFKQFLVPPTNLPFSEVFFFSNVARVKRHIVGTPRAAIHMALNNPHYYLEVSKVCRMSSCRVLSSLLCWQ
jgi:origin recognition complex subunit 3